MSLQVRMNARLRMKLVSMNRSDHIASMSYPVKISSKSVHAYFQNSHFLQLFSLFVICVSESFPTWGLVSLGLLIRHSGLMVEDKRLWQ